MAATSFRAGVGAVITNERRQVLACERRDIPGAWQFPQGGIDDGEEPIDAVLREIHEETGIVGSDLRLIAECPELLAYEVPPHARSARMGRGQVQRWFLFAYGGQAEVVLPEGGEFVAWAWRSFDEVERQVVEFRRPVYRRVRECFSL